MTSQLQAKHSFEWPHHYSTVQNRFQWHHHYSTLQNRFQWHHHYRASTGVKDINVPVQHWFQWHQRSSTALVSNDINVPVQHGFQYDSGWRTHKRQRTYLYQWFSGFNSLLKAHAGLCTWRVPGPARCMARKVFSTLFLCFISTETLDNSGTYRDRGHSGEVVGTPSPRPIGFRPDVRTVCHTGSPSARGTWLYQDSLIVGVRNVYRKEKSSNMWTSIFRVLLKPNVFFSHTNEWTISILYNSYSSIKQAKGIEEAYSLNPTHTPRWTSMLASYKHDALYLKHSVSRHYVGENIRTEWEIKPTATSVLVHWYQMARAVRTGMLIHGMGYVWGEECNQNTWER